MALAGSHAGAISLRWPRPPLGRTGHATYAASAEYDRSAASVYLLGPPSGLIPLSGLSISKAQKHFDTSFYGFPFAGKQFK
jgi:hypothetical protein